MLRKRHCLYYISLLALHFTSLLLLPNSCSSFGTHLKGFHCYKDFTVIAQPSSSSSGLLWNSWDQALCHIWLWISWPYTYLAQRTSEMFAEWWELRCFPCLLPHKTYKLCINTPFGRWTTEASHLLANYLVEVTQLLGDTDDLWSQAYFTPNPNLLLLHHTSTT